jgi:tetratricopeptide (TPR) repeat protein
MSLRFAIAAAFALSTAVPASAKSREDSQIEEFAKQAEAKYKQGDFRGSAELLLRAYEVKALPKLLYNAARAYDKAGDTNEAMRFYQRYLDAEKTDPDLVKKSARALDRLRASIPSPAPPAPTPPPAPSPEVKPAPEAAVAPAPTANELIQRAPPPSSPRRFKFATAAAGGLAVVSLGAGTFFAVTANRESAVFKASQDPDLKPTLRDHARRDAMFADVGLGVGLVLAAATITLFLIGRPAALPAEGGGSAAGMTWDF